MSNESRIIAIAGNPNTGKTALFNALTGLKQKTGNYPGVTVDKKEGILLNSTLANTTVIDIPGTYSLATTGIDEQIAKNILLGIEPYAKKSPDFILYVVDSSNLALNLRLFFDLKKLNIPMFLILNIYDLAEIAGVEFNLNVLEQKLGVKCIPTIATKSKGIERLMAELNYLLPTLEENKQTIDPQIFEPKHSEITDQVNEIDAIIRESSNLQGKIPLITQKIDKVLLHPYWGPVLLILILGLMFQFVFNLATYPQDWIESGFNSLKDLINTTLPKGILTELLVEGIISSAGSVIIFLPQILILFFFLLLIEGTGYMARAAYLLDRLMRFAGLNGKSFISLLSSFACAVPGIISARTIEDPKTRLTTIMLSPLMTCSARLPVYALLIAAFVPQKYYFGFFNLQGLVMFALYVIPIIVAMLTSLVVQKKIFKSEESLLLLELPTYKLPSLVNILLGLKDRAFIFLQKAGTNIVFIGIIMWLLSNFPRAADTNASSLASSYAGKIGNFILPILEPIGFNWQISVALIPGFAAREVLVGALGTVYAVGDNPDVQSEMLPKIIQNQWSLATGIALLAWYMFSPQCLATFAVIKKETNSLRFAIGIFTYMTFLAYLAAFIAYKLTLFLQA